MIKLDSLPRNWARLTPLTGLYTCTGERPSAQKLVRGRQAVRRGRVSLRGALITTAAPEGRHRAERGCVRRGEGASSSPVGA